MPLPRAAPDNGSSDQPARTILVVEDDILIRSTLAEFLRDAGYHVFEAVNAAEAKAVLNAGAVVDLVFSDVRMPGEESGVALAGWIRRQHPDTAVLLTSGFADAKETRQLPADILVLRKPYALSDVLRHIQILLRQARAGNS